jgi:hypothetical protein
MKTLELMPLVENTNIPSWKICECSSFCTIFLPVVRTPIVEFQRGSVILYYKPTLQMLTHTTVLSQIQALLKGINLLNLIEQPRAFAAKARLIGATYPIPIEHVRIFNSHEHLS